MRRLALLSTLFGLLVGATPSTMTFTATAYCQRGETKSGTRVRTGIVAGDPTVLPVGTVLRIVEGPFSGVYTVMDTGAAIKGRRIDIFMPDCKRAEAFGEKRLRLRILRHGWNPKATPSDG
jgi:3D (Asp-Asp-Asp) domain-containing protein